MERLTRIGIGLWISVWVARYLGPQQYGTLNYALAIVVLFSASAKLGLDGIVVRDFAKEPDRKGEILGTAFALRILAGLIASSFAIMLVWNVESSTDITRWLVVIISVRMLFQSFDVIDIWFQSQLQSEYTAFAKSAAFLCATLARIVLILTRAPLIAFACVYVLDIMVGALGLLFCWKRIYAFKWHLSFSCALTLLRQGFPLLISGFAVLIIMNVDKAMLGGLYGKAEVGIYSASANIAKVCYFVPVTVGALVTSILVKKKKDSDSEFNHALEKVFDSLLAGALLIAIPGIVLSEPIIHFLYGARYESSSQVLIAKLLCLPFVFHISIRTRALVIEESHGLVCVYSYITMVVNIGINLVLIPTYGAVGAAYASLIAWFCSALVLPWISKKTSKYPAMFVKGPLRIIGLATGSS